jgi:hypothetical protein
MNALINMPMWAYFEQLMEFKGRENPRLFNSIVNTLIGDRKATYYIFFEEETEDGNKYYLYRVGEELKISSDKESLLNIVKNDIARAKEDDIIVIATNFVLDIDASIIRVAQIQAQILINFWSQQCINAESQIEQEKLLQEDIA